MSDSENQQSEPLPNKRPDDVTALFHDGEAYPQWVSRNWEKKRFYVPNVESIIFHYWATAGKKKDAKIILNEAFQKTPMVIAEENPSWLATYPGTYQAGGSWVEKYRLREARSFPIAAGLIVGLELAFKEIGAAVNVYDLLRIVPGFYYVDHFDQTKLDRILNAFANLSPDDVQRKFGPGAVGKSFYEICYGIFGQGSDGSVLKALANGSLATRFVCQSLKDLVNAQFDVECHLGDLKCAGQDGSNEVLGTKDTSPNLRVISQIARDELKPCF